MTEEIAIINPYAPKGGPPLPPLAVLAGNLGDLATVCGNLGIDKSAFRSFITSRLYHQPKSPYALVGPMIGAPYAVMLMETLMAWGSSSFLFFGWCGAVSPDVNIGDIIVPTAAFIDEGTSLHYHGKTGDPAVSGTEITESIIGVLNRSGLPHHRGAIWTTDGFYRETPERVKHFQSRNALAVEMELSALFSVGKFRNLDVGAVLVVSDTLADFSWRQGFKDPRFKAQRRAVCEVISELCKAR